MAKTLVLTAGIVFSAFSVVSFIYYKEKSSKNQESDNLLYNLGSFLDAMWFVQHK